MHIIKKVLPDLLYIQYFLDKSVQNNSIRFCAQRGESIDFSLAYDSRFWNSLELRSIDICPNEILIADIHSNFKARITWSKNFKKINLAVYKNIILNFFRTPVEFLYNKSSKVYKDVDQEEIKRILKDLFVDARFARSKYSDINFSN